MKYLNISLVFACFTLLFTACDDSNIFNEDNPIPPVESLNLIENMLASEGEYDDFIKAITKAGLDNRLGNSGTYTILAPTKEAMAEYILSKDPNPTDSIIYSINDIDGVTLRSDFAYHAINGIKKSTDFDGFGYTETISNEGPEGNFLSFYFDNSGSNMVINNAANVTFDDTELANGLIHSINTVLTPPNIMDMINYNPEFSNIGQALIDRGFNDNLTVGSRNTFFAPCNEAFPKLQEEYANYGQDSLDALIDTTLLFHLITDTIIFSNDMEPGSDIQTSILKNLSFVEDTIANEIFIRDFAGRNSYFKQKDIFAKNGILHTIDKVLMTAGAN